RKEFGNAVDVFQTGPVAAEAGWMLRPGRWGPVHIQRQSSHVINSQLRRGLRSKNSRPGELTASGAHDLAPKEKCDSVHYGGPSCIPSPPNGNPLRWRHLTEISRSACWTMMVSSIRSHLRVTRTGPIGSTLGVRGTSISSRPTGATGVNSTSRRAEQPRKLQDGTCGRLFIGKLRDEYISGNREFLAGNMGHLIGPSMRAKFRSRSGGGRRLYVRQSERAVR